MYEVPFTLFQSHDLGRAMSRGCLRILASAKTCGRCQMGLEAGGRAAHGGCQTRAEAHTSGPHSSARPVLGQKSSFGCAARVMIVAM